MLQCTTGEQATDKPQKPRTPGFTADGANNRKPSKDETHKPADVISTPLPPNATPVSRSSQCHPSITEAHHQPARCLARLQPAINSAQEFHSQSTTRHSGNIHRNVSRGTVYYNLPHKALPPSPPWPTQILPAVMAPLPLSCQGGETCALGNSDRLVAQSCCGIL